MIFNKKNILVGIAILVIAFILGFMVGGKSSQSETVGSFDVTTRFPNGHLDTNGGYYVDGTAVINGSGQISTLNLANVGTFTQGGGIFSTSTGLNQPSATLLSTYFDTENFVSVTLGTTTGTVTVTLPASSTLSSMIPNAGDHRQIVIYSASTTVTTITMAAGTGETLISTASTSDKVIAPGAAAKFDLWRLATGGNILVEMIPAK